MCIEPLQGYPVQSICEREKDSMSRKEEETGKARQGFLLLRVLVLGLALEGSLDHVDKRAESAEQGAEAEAPALDADGVDEEVDLKRCVS
jgi:hypothetical protein